APRGSDGVKDPRLPFEICNLKSAILRVPGARRCSVRSAWEEYSDSPRLGVFQYDQLEKSIPAPRGSAAFRAVRLGLTGGEETLSFFLPGSAAGDWCPLLDVATGSIIPLRAAQPQKTKTESPRPRRAGRACPH